MPKGLQGFQKGNKLFAGKHHSKESKEKLRLAHLGKKYSYGPRPSMRGKNHPMYGKHLSEETKRKIRETEKGKYTGENSFSWKDGRHLRKGYIYVYQPNHPFNTKKYVLEHRLIIEKIIGRYLKPAEKCHHINGIRTDNRPENLMAFKNEGIHHKFEWNKRIKKSDIIFDGRKLK